MKTRMAAEHEARLHIQLWWMVYWDICTSQVCYTPTQGIQRRQGPLHWARAADRERIRSGRRWESRLRDRGLSYPARDIGELMDDGRSNALQPG